MKIYLRVQLTGLALGLSIISGFGQQKTYTPFDFKNGQWVCGYDTKGGVFGNYGTYYIKEEVKFYCQGDTVINDTIFNKLYYIGVTRYPEWAQRQLSGYYGPIRNDTLHRQVWFGSRLLYDFNLQEDDSITFHCESGQPIISIDSVLYCGQYHRRYNYKNASNDDLYMIEGIGSIYGLIPKGCTTSISWLACYSEKNNLICDTCKTPTSVNEVVLGGVEVYPNPTDDRIKVTASVPVLSIEIWDLLGRPIYHDDSIDRNEIEIIIREKGIYLVRVEIQGKVVVKKILRN